MFQKVRLGLIRRPPGADERLSSRPGFADVAGTFIKWYLQSAGKIDWLFCADGLYGSW